MGSIQPSRDKVAFARAERGITVSIDRNADGGGTITKLDHNDELAGSVELSATEMFWLIAIAGPAVLKQLGQ